MIQHGTQICFSDNIINMSTATANKANLKQQHFSQIVYRCVPALNSLT